jgi:hypothetical protein
LYYSFGVGVGLTTLHRKNKRVTKDSYEHKTWKDSLYKRSKRPNSLTEIGLDGVDWIGLTLGKDKWRVLVNQVVNFGFNQMLGNYRGATHLVASRVVLSSIELVK